MTFLFVISLLYFSSRCLFERESGILLGNKLDRSRRTFLHLTNHTYIAW